MGIKDNTHMLMMDRNSDERRQADPRLDRQAGTGELTPAPARILSNLHCGRGDRDPTWGTAWKSSTLAVQAGLFGRINRTTGLHQSDRSCRQDHRPKQFAEACKRMARSSNPRCHPSLDDPLGSHCGRSGRLAKKPLADRGRAIHSACRPGHMSCNMPVRRAIPCHPKGSGRALRYLVQSSRLPPPPLASRRRGNRRREAVA
jgi:hypothetical protein